VWVIVHRAQRVAPEAAAGLDAKDAVREVVLRALMVGWMEWGSHECCDSVSSG